MTAPSIAFPVIPANKNSIAKRRLVCGVGINDADYMVAPRINGKHKTCPFYSVWQSMLVRCYSPKFQNTRPTYIGCSVTPEWLSFLTFKKWMEAQNWQGKQLDKDIMYLGNKVYSPEACLFVTKHINSLLGDCGARRGKYAQGVSEHKPYGTFVAHVRINGEAKYLGVFDTQEKAAIAYRKEKRLYILRVACCEPDIRVKQGLYRHSELFRE